jgi:conjugal transfer pilus assembly protein TraL
MEEDFWIPRNLDAPPLLFIWEADVAFVYIFWFLLGGILNMVFLGIFFGVIMGKTFARLKEDGGSGLILKLIYWYTPSDILICKSHPSYNREFIGG